MSTGTLTRSTRTPDGAVSRSERTEPVRAERMRIERERTDSASTAPTRSGRTRTGEQDRVRLGAGTRPRRQAHHEPVRPADRRPARPAVGQLPRAAGTRCAVSTAESRLHARRRATALAVLVGCGLAVLVWVVTIVGSNYAASVQPSPVGTEIVHVRQGDSLSTIADRIAPDVPRQAVIDQIVERNDLSGSGLRVGQALVAPAYG